jgi:tRNA(Met) cytidine acetyltransferase
VRTLVHRFLPWLGGRRATLDAPLRWPAGDPLEAWLRDLLLLDAAPGPAPSGPGEAVHLAKDRLAADEPLLRGVFGLLQDAHYRTTPGDLVRLLDAPNLDVHAILDQGRPLAVALVAREGGLPDDVVAGMCAGVRIRGHALPDTLVAHSGRPDAAALRWIRSVRIATHPDLRRSGVARRLVDHVHASATPDAFGTLFGGTPELIRFRRALGYVPVRLGATRGARSGEPSVVLVRPVSEAARALVADLRAQLARDLPTQLALLAVDSGFPVDDALVAELSVDLPAPAPPGDVARYTRGPAPYEACAVAIEALVADRAADVAASPDRALLVGRAVERRSWRSLGATSGGVAAAMRAMRRAVAALAAQAR